MLVDHIFIFSNNLGQEADELVDFGLSEGSSRIHRGQGTTNRKFYFENFFFELLWVHDEEEIQKEPVSNTGLWERSNFKKNGSSPFGLCLVNTEEVDSIFSDCSFYQPEYFPPGKQIEVAFGNHSPQLPWTFRLPFKGLSKKPDEPRAHENGISILTSVCFGVTDYTETEPALLLEKEGGIRFQKSDQPHLWLEFDSNRQGKEKALAQLPITVRY